MPSKKKKFNSRFPPARIKKIMQKDEEIGKVAAVVPVIISRALELFVEQLLKKAYDVTKANNSKTLSTNHIKSFIQNSKDYSFLNQLTTNITDISVDDENQANHQVKPVSKRGRKKKIVTNVFKENAGPSHAVESSEESSDDNEDNDDNIDDSDSDDYKMTIVESTSNLSDEQCASSTQEENLVS